MFPFAVRSLIGFVGAALALQTAIAQGGTPPKVRVLRVPDGGLQPQVAVDRKGTIHLIYYKGDARQGDIFYARSTDGGTTFSPGIPVNSHEGSAIAAGTIRGAQIALGKDGRVHVAWNGSAKALPHGSINPESGRAAMPMLYTRLNDAGTAFEPQRNLMRSTFGLDGGGSVTADDAGNVYVTWHASSEGAPKGEGGRRVWIARSADNGKTFSAEAPAWDQATGACGCCGMRLFADSRGQVYALYRSATREVHRDIYLLVSKTKAEAFRGTLLHEWEINACPMSSMSFAEGSTGVLAAWETQGQVYYAAIDPKTLVPSRAIPAPESGKGRKHPVLAAGPAGETLLVWTEGTGWQKGGSLAWQIFDKNGQPTLEKGQAPDLPAWSSAAAFRANGGFTVLY